MTVRNLLSKIGLCLAVACGLTGCAAPLFSGSSTSWSKFEQEHVFVQARYPQGNWNPTAFEFEDVWFSSDDGTRLNGWYCHHEKPTAVLLFAHGNAGNVTHCAETLRMLHDRYHMAVMSFDYRGYGKSDGEPSEHGILEDTRAARRWLARRSNVAERDVVLMGQSLGGGVAVDLASRDGARGLILLSTFTSLPDVAAHHWPLLPTGLLMHNRFHSISKIDEYHGPLLQVHGDKDRTVPFAQGQKLFARAHEPKRFVINHGAGHNDPLPDEFGTALGEFIAALPAAQPLPKQPRWHATGAAE